MGELASINVVVLGNKQVGKSTMVAALVGQVGKMPKRLHTRFKGEAVPVPEGGFQYTWIQQTLELEKKYTTASIDNTISRIETDRYECTLLDAPSGGDPGDAITYISQADIALIVIDATNKDVRMKRKNREFAFLAVGLGLKKIIFCVNKMDQTKPPYSSNQYEAIVKEISTYRYHGEMRCETEFQFLPCCAVKMENLTKGCTSLGYAAQNLIQIVDSTDDLSWPHLDHRPLRLPVMQTHKINPSVTIVVGRIQSGVLKPGMEVAIVPPVGVTCTVKTIETNGFPLAQAFPGDNVRVYLDNVPIKHIASGQVLSDPTVNPAMETIGFTGLLIVRNRKKPIKAPFSCFMHCHISHTTAKIDRLLSIVDDHGNVVENDPTSVRNGDRTIVKIVPLARHFALEPFEECPSLGRFVLRDTENIIAVGTVISVEKKLQSYEAEDGHSAGPTLGEVNRKINERERVENNSPSRRAHLATDRGASYTDDFEAQVVESHDHVLYLTDASDTDDFETQEVESRDHVLHPTDGLTVQAPGTTQLMQHREPFDYAYPSPDDAYSYPQESEESTLQLEDENLWTLGLSWKEKGTDACCSSNPTK